MDKPNNITVAGCVLAGGQSTRMGTDKALLELNGKTLIAHAIEKLSGFEEIIISAADPNDYAFTGIRVVPDDQPGLGPLGGFISVLKAIDSEYVCFRPVDAPLIPAKLHTLLLESCVGKDAAVPTHKKSVEPLIACVAKSALPVLERQIASGKHKASDAFSLLDTSFIYLDSKEMLRDLGNPKEYLINANDPAAFAKLGKR